MHFVGPLIAVEALTISREFYENVLNQKVKYDFKENITFECGLSIHEKSHFSGLLRISEDEMLQKSNNAELYFEENNLEQFLVKLKVRDISFVHPLIEQSWGQRVVRFYDPDGHIIEVGETMQSVVKRFLEKGLTTEETAKRTSMPVEFVRGCL